MQKATIAFVLEWLKKFTRCSLENNISAIQYWDEKKLAEELDLISFSGLEEANQSTLKEYITQIKLLNKQIYEIKNSKDNNQAVSKESSNLKLGMLVTLSGFTCAVDVVCIGLLIPSQAHWVLLVAALVSAFLISIVSGYFASKEHALPAPSI